MNKQKQTAEVSVKEMPAKPKVSKKDTWEIKDRNYHLIGGRSPLTFTLASKHTKRFPLLWFDKEKGYERELRYATNQKSPFVDEQEGTSTLAHLDFEDGVLTLPKNKQSLQKLL